MSSRPIFTPYSVIDNASMATSLTSKVTVIQNLSMLSYDITWTAGSTPIGVMSVQVSNSYTQNADGSVRNAGSWTTIALSSPAPVSGNTGNGFIEVDLTGAYAVRLVYTRTSGSGLMTAIVNGKVA